VSGAAGIDRTRPPEPGELRSFRFPEFERAELENGVRILVARRPRVPLVTLEFLFPAGGQYDPPGFPGLASLHGELLDEGAAGRSALEVAAEVEALGGALDSGAGWNMAFVEAGVLARHLGAGLELLADLLRSPTFAEEEVERLRQERLADLLRRRDFPRALADQCLAAAIYGDGPYGRPLIGTAESVAAIDRRAVVDFYRRHAVPRGTILIATGDLDPGEVIARAGELVGEWSSGPPPQRPELAPRPLDGVEVHLVDRPGAAQTELQLGHAGVSRTDPDFHRLLLLNALFGGKFTSRINLNLRERHGYTYSVHSYFTRRQGPGPFVVRTAVATEVTGAAARELLFEMRRIREEPVTEEELEETRDYVVGVFPYTLQTLDGVARRLEALAVHRLPDDYYEHYPEELLHVTREELLEAARRRLHPERLAVVAVGPAAALRPQLEELGPVTVHTPEELG